MQRPYYIPSNFLESGYVLNGAVAIRNFVEGCVLAFLGFLVCKLLNLPSGVDAITWYIMLMFPPFMIGVYGVSGDPLSVFLMDVYNWRKRRRPYLYNNHNEAFSISAADLMLEEPQLRDMIADTIDRVRKNMAGEDIDYIEGETFKFAVDPEQEALRDAEERKAEEAAEAQDALEQKSAEVKEAASRLKKAKGGKAPNPDSEKASVAGSLDVADIVNNIHLQDVVQDSQDGGDGHG